MARKSPILDASGRPMTKFGYDATDNNGRRKQTTIRHASEDTELNNRGRSLINSANFDLVRNYSLLAWALRKHADYVTSFRFQATDDDEGWNKELQDYVSYMSEPDRCDIAGRHSFAKMTRILEGLAVIGGDSGLMKLNTLHLQGIESDRVRDVTGAEDGKDPRKEGDTWIHGIKINKAGRAEKYAVHRRKGTSFEFDTAVPAQNMIWHGYFERFDQVRGISPLSSAINQLKDTYEAADFALAKMKVSQLMAMAFFYDDGDPDDPLADQKSEVETSGDEASRPIEPPRIDFGKLGPKQINMKKGEDVKFLESDQPSSGFQDFHKFTISVSLKSVDIPYCFFDEGYTNFYGSRAAEIQYVRACKEKRKNLRHRKRQVTRFWLQGGILDGMITLPSGKTVDDVKADWIPDGVPWWDPSKEVNGDVQKISAGLDNPQRICRERDTGDWYENVREISKAIEFAKKLGVPISFAPLTPQMNVVDADEVSNGKG